MSTFQKATFAGGCFWCTEAIFQRIKGVSNVMSGYAGGTIPNPTYEQVSVGDTGYAEAVQLTFDPEVINYEQLLEIFWTTHDPTTLNQQGADMGTQYRSVIFYHDEVQHKAAENKKQELTDQQIFDKPIITEIVPVESFYPAEDYHQDFYNNHPYQSYCQIVISPKLQKLKQKYVSFLKD